MSHESVLKGSMLEDTLDISTGNENLTRMRSRNDFRDDSSMEVALGDCENFKEKYGCPKVDVQYCHDSNDDDFERNDFDFTCTGFQKNLATSGNINPDASQKGRLSNDYGSGWDDAANQILRKRYNPRKAFLTNDKQQVSQRQLGKQENFEKGENPEESTQIEINYEDKQHEGSGKSPHMKNYVVDYRNLRKSGYFLSCQKEASRTPTPPALMINTSFITSKTDQVEDWLDCLPGDSIHLIDSDEDIMGEQEFQDISNERFHFPSKLSSEEDNIKRLLLKRRDSMEYTSQPMKTLTYVQLESILETANRVVDDCLKRLHKSTENDEYEYVSGKIEIPSFKEQDNQKLFTPSDTSSGDSWLQRVRKWASSFFYNEENHQDNSCDIEIGRKVILEPYHGPVVMNGAVIESGSTNLLLRKGLFGTAVEEVKAALHAISEALRRISSRPSSPPQKLLERSYAQEDPEIQRLTEMVQNKESRKKSTYRTVFGLKNTEKIPSYSLIYRRRRIPRRRPGFFRAVNGWIQRKSNPYAHRQRYRIISTADAARNQPPPPVTSTQTQRRTQTPRDQNPDSGSLFTSIMSAMRWMVPFQLTPAVPASAVLDVRNEPVELSRSRLNSRHEMPLIIPTRYQISRSSSRTNTKAKSIKVKKIHVGEDL